MRSKYCYKCGGEKERRAAPYCNKCQRGYNRDDYVKNKAAYIAKARRNNERYQEEIKAWILDYLSTYPCIDCGEKDPVVLEFDHRGNEGKSADISVMKRQKKTLEKIKLEVAKCDVRCANCHRRKTAKKQNWYKSFAPVAQPGQERSATNAGQSEVQILSGVPVMQEGWPQGETWGGVPGHRQDPLYLACTSSEGAVGQWETGKNVRANVQTPLAPPTVCWDVVQ